MSNSTLIPIHDRIDINDLFLIDVKNLYVIAKIQKNAFLTTFLT